MTTAISPRSGPRYADALAYAATLHAAQLRKGGSVPYVAHLLDASALVWQDGGTEDQAIAALLHDAAEDQGGRPRLEEIRGRFGDAVAEIVEACTDAWDEPKPPWGPRKRAFVAGLHAAPEDALIVIAADKLSNVTSIVVDHDAVGDAVWSRFSATKDEVSWYHQAVHAALAERIPQSRSVRLLGPAVADLAARAAPESEPAALADR